MKKLIYSFFLLLVAALAMCPFALAGIDDEPSAREYIHVCNQKDGSEEDGCDIKNGNTHNTMGHSGCVLYSYVHSVQWLTRENWSESELRTFINDMLAVHFKTKTGSAAYKKEIIDRGWGTQITDVSLQDCLKDGNGAAIIYEASRAHWLCAIGAQYGDVDGDGVDEWWIHIVDSAAYQTLGYLNGKGVNAYSFDTHNIINASGYQYKDLYGAEYWVNKLDVGGSSSAALLVQFKFRTSKALTKSKAYLSHNILKPNKTSIVTTTSESERKFRFLMETRG